MRNPNGYGSITKYKGNRRKPYVVRVDKETVPEGGNSKKMKKERVVLGSYKTKAEANAALVAYNQNPINFSSDMTLYEIFEMWSERRYEKISQSGVKSYNAAMKKLESLWNIPLRNIRYISYQDIIDGMSDLSFSSKKNVVSLLSQLYDFAIKNEFLTPDKKISSFLEIGESEKSDKHYPFRKNQLETMFRWAEKNDYVQMILIIIYSGARLKEMFDLKKTDVHLEENYLYIRHGKTKNATRRIPIHKAIRPFVENWMNNPSEYLFCEQKGKKFSGESRYVFNEIYFKPLLNEMGILQYISESGDTHEHLPYDCRHTFTTLWKQSSLDEGMRRKIQGHSGKGIGEIVYTHYEFEVLCKEMDKLPCY